ncbi:MAG: DUF2288 domain-containing protein [Cyanobacteria bacterium J06621_12]
MSSLKEKLTKEVADISWQELQPHARRDAIIVVKKELDLPEVAAAIAEDNTIAVQEWISSKSIAKPSARQLTDWNKSPDKQFIALIVQPFVVVKEAS